MSSQAENEAERVKVEDFSGFDCWRIFRWMADFGAGLSEFWMERGFTVTKESAFKECSGDQERQRQGS